MTDKPIRATDKQTGISIRFIQEWKPQEREEFPHDWVALFDSCAWLGHTFVINTDEMHCNICGAPRP